MLCEALHDLDVKSRAAFSIVNDWRGPICEKEQVDDLQPTASPSPVQTVWNVTDLFKFLVEALKGSRSILATCESISPKKSVEEGESREMRGLLEAYMEMARRLSSAVSGFISILTQIEDQDGKLAIVSSNTQKYLEELTKAIEFAEHFSQCLEWEELNSQALAPSEFKRLAAYLLETGKASA
jgi:phosphoglycolate phosphatase-like HAD superfamily hydrolase